MSTESSEAEVRTVKLVEIPTLNVATDTLVATCRQFTGQAWRFRAYVRDIATGTIIAACDHKHRSRWRRSWKPGPGGKNGEFYAMRCAKRMLAAIRRKAGTKR